jgi:hypothetical protein
MLREGVDQEDDSEKIERVERPTQESSENGVVGTRFWLSQVTGDRHRTPQTQDECWM